MWVTEQDEPSGFKHAEHGELERSNTQLYGRDLTTDGTDKTDEVGADFFCFGEDVHAAKNVEWLPCEHQAADQDDAASRHTMLWSRAILSAKSSICFTTDIPATRVPPCLRMTLKVVFGMQPIGPSNNAWFSWFFSMRTDCQHLKDSGGDC